MTKHIRFPGTRLSYCGLRNSEELVEVDQIFQNPDCCMQCIRGYNCPPKRAHPMSSRRKKRK